MMRWDDNPTPISRSALRGIVNSVLISVVLWGLIIAMVYFDLHV